MNYVKGLAHVAIAVSVGWCLPVHADAVTDWNVVTLSCVQGPPAPPNRGGPPGLMDIALVQLAVHDAVQAIQGRFEAYQYENPALLGVGSASAAAASAAYETLVGIYGADDPCLVGIADPDVTYAGDPALQAGHEAAAAMVPLYRPTMVLPTDPFVGSTEPGQWRPTPGVTAGANTFMAVTAPFGMLRPSHFRPPPPPPLVSTRYYRDYEEVRLVGSATSTVRTPEQTDLARFWSVNFIPQWFATLRAIAGAGLSDVGDTARLFALVGIATADSQISVYDAKYHYNFWRPITAIREGDNDGNARTVGDPTWTPLIGTPPYPDHHSGANMLVASITGILRQYFGSDELSFSISSSAAGVVVNPRHYTQLSQAEQELVDVRVYQGIHFRTADELGRVHGGRVAHWTFKKFLRPLPGTR
jgi:hypothetical protein